MQGAKAMTTVVCPAAHARPTRPAFGSRVPSKALHQQRKQQASRLVLQAVQTQAPTDNRFPRWDFMWKQLAEAKLVTVRPDEAADMIASGEAVLLDVRPKDVYEKAHPKGSISAPMFQQIDMSQPSMGKVLKMAAMLANGVQPTEYNPAFLDQVAAAAKDGKAVILACEAGGTMAASTNFATGKASRSLKGCWKIISSQALPPERVFHLDGGVYRWFTTGQEFEGEYDTSNVGRTPNVVDSQ